MIFRLSGPVGVPERSSCSNEDAASHSLDEGEGGDAEGEDLGADEEEAEEEGASFAEDGPDPDGSASRRAVSSAACSKISTLDELESPAESVMETNGEALWNESRNHVWKRSKRAL